MENWDKPTQMIKLRVELDLKLGIAKGVIGSLADDCCHSAGHHPFDARLSPAQRLIEAARRAYVLPADCSERATSVSECLECILEQRLPEQCQRDEDVVGSSLDELDVSWNMKKV